MSIGGLFGCSTEDSTVGAFLSNASCMAHDQFERSVLQNPLVVSCLAAVVKSCHLHLSMSVHIIMPRQDEPSCDFDPRFTAQAEDPSPGLALV